MTNAIAVKYRATRYITLSHTQGELFTIEREREYGLEKESELIEPAGGIFQLKRDGELEETDTT